MIITYYCMPGMTGYELLKKVKGSSTFREVPVVIMSSERIDRCLEEGAEDFIVKLADVKRLKDYVFGEDKLVSENRGMNKKVAKCVRLFLRFNARRSLDDTWDQRMS